MKILNFFRAPQKRTAAQVAKERLQIIVSHESSRTKGGGFIKDLQAELLEVISKYVKIDKEQIKVQLDQKGDQSVLELNVTLPDTNMEVNIALPNNPTVAAKNSSDSEEAKKAKRTETTEV